MSDPQWDTWAEHKKETMLDDIKIALSKVEIFKGELELKSVISYVDAEYDDWDRFITKEDLEKLFKEYAEEKSKV